MAEAISELLGRYVKNILDIIPQGVFISDASGRTLYVNRMYEQLTGLKQKDIEGKNVRSLVREGVFDLVVNPEIVTTGQPQTYAQQLKDGTRLVISGFPVFDSRGVIRLVVTFARDITILSELQDQVVSQRRLIDQISDQLAHMTEENLPVQPVHSSRIMAETMRMLRRYADSDATVLILGETGVGKDVYGRLLHSLSSRQDKVLLKVDCGAISESLIEAELFGYLPGAFTGALNRGKAGYFEMADGGTIFLDEIGELSPTMQTRLLRVLQDGEIMRVGASSPRKVDVRVIAATNRDLAQCVEEGTFRRDLFYRLNVAILHIPPLRERTEDIPLLAEHFLRQYAAKYHKALAFMNVTLDCMTAYEWPGNVRELQNLVHSLVLAANGPLVSPADLPIQISGENHSLPASPYLEEILEPKKSLKQIMAEIERDFLTRAIEAHGSVQKVAELFQLNRSTIFRKLRTAPAKE